MKLNILSKLLLFILVPALAGLCVVTGLSYREADNSITMQVRSDMGLLVEGQQRELSTVIDMLFEIMHNTTESGSLVSFAREHSNSTNSEEIAFIRQLAAAQLATMVKSFPLLAEAAYVDAKGVIVLHTTTSSIGGFRGDREYFAAAMQGKQSAENLRSRTNNELTTILAVPVMDNGKPLGVMFIRMDTAAINKNVTDRIRIGEAGSCFVMDDTGVMLMHGDKKLVGTDITQYAWGRTILAEKNGRLVYPWNGVNKIAYFRNIPQTEWTVVVAVEQDEVLAAVGTMLRSNLIVMCVNALIVGLIIFFVARSIARAMSACADVVGQVAEGNTSLTADQERDLHLVAQRTDELGQLGGGIGRMVENIRRLFRESQQKTDEALKATEEARKATIEAEMARTAAENAKNEGMLAAAVQLEGIVNVLSSASEQLSAQITESEHGAGQQAARITETATAMEEMNSTVLEVARNASTASDVSGTTRQRAEAGARVVQEAVQSILRVQQQSLELKEDMSTLGQNAQSISQIMGVISDIADQTNLLALNAAIEAARAGEAGRGFAVVADEVRKLAEKTMQSTTDVGNAIRAIQQSADKSMNQVDEAVITIDAATRLAEQSGAALSEIVTLVDSTADQVRAIATASEEQSATSEEINRSVIAVNGIAGETSRAMQQASSAMHELTAQVHALSRLIEDLKHN